MDFSVINEHYSRNSMSVSSADFLARQIVGGIYYSRIPDVMSVWNSEYSSLKPEFIRTFIDLVNKYSSGTLRAIPLESNDNNYYMKIIATNGNSIVISFDFQVMQKINYLK